MFAPNVKQLEVLEWIATGCPDRDWPDFSHRISARALAGRGLVQVRGHGPSWEATVTTAGRELLDGGGATAEQPKAPRIPKARSATPRPATKPVRTNARATDSAPVATGIPVPAAADPDSPIVRALRAAPETLQVAASSMDRATRLVQALADEATRRGYRCSVPGERICLRVRIGDIDADFRMHEEKDKVTTVTQEDREKVRYSWQRARLQQMKTWSGRLVLTLAINPWNLPTWADRKRWALDSRLPHALARAEEWAEGEKAKCDAVARANDERRRVWEAAVPKAQVAYIESLNRDRLTAQIEDLTRARSMRSYADAVEAHLRDLPADHQRQAQEWLTWIRSDADRIDPLRRPQELQFERPEELRTPDVDRFMPRGMTSAAPPD